MRCISHKNMDILCKQFLFKYKPVQIPVVTSDSKLVKPVIKINVTTLMKNYFTLLQKTLLQKT